jgi:ectoine hydroxylase-related dioxygenase (phytanoyl-CoA dioxygenase family)
VKAVADYLGAAPVLWDITAMYSPPADGALRGSQHWHRDGDDVTNVKVWILCSDVSKENGPTLCLPKALSDKIAKDIAYKQSDKILDDRLIDPYQSDVFSLVGKAGDAFVTDTSRCFHMGSRTTSDSERLVLMFHFVSSICDLFLARF